MRIEAALITAALIVASLFVSPTAASAKDVYSYFSTTESFDWFSFDDASNIEMSHPDKVVCATTDFSGNPTCELTAKARFTNSKPASFVDIEMRDASGNLLDTEYMWTSYGTSWQNLTFTTSLTESKWVRFQLAKSSSFSSTSQSAQTYLFAGPTPEFSTLEVPFDDEVLDESVVSVNWANGRFTFVQIYFPKSVQTSKSCFDYQVFVRPIDFETGETGSENITDNLNFDMSIERSDYSSDIPASNHLNAGSIGWRDGAEANELVTRVCGASDKLGVVKNFTLTMTVELEGIVSPYEFEEKFSTLGDQVYRSINCLKGKTIKVVTSPKPVCPTGYSKTNLAVSSGKLKATSITCVRGLEVRRISGILPSCPSGWKRK